MGQINKRLRVGNDESNGKFSLRFTDLQLPFLSFQKGIMPDDERSCIPERDVSRPYIV